MTGLSVLVIGGGGREASFVRALDASSSVEYISIAPGNAGPGPHRVDIDVTDHGAVVAHCMSAGIDLVVIGPEVPLVDGLADSLFAAGVTVLGPSAAGARLEGSKGYARERTTEWGIPGPRWTTVSPLPRATGPITCGAVTLPPTAWRRDS